MKRQEEIKLKIELLKSLIVAWQNQYTLIINHYGHTVDSEIPTTGVLNISDINIQVLSDEMNYGNGINLSEQDRLDEFKSNPFNPDYEIELSGLSDSVQDEIGNLGVLWDSLSETAQDEILILQQYYDRSESYPDDIWIIGDWIKDENGEYEPDKTGEYSAIVRESTIQVVWSKYVIRVSSLCSPCYPGQCSIDVDDEGDYLTSDTGYLCYNLPDEFYDNDY